MGMLTDGNTVAGNASVDQGNKAIILTIHSDAISAVDSQDSF
jgi:hypothetical protein